MRSADSSESERAGRFCVLVASSDRARDIFETTFQNAGRIWTDCDWPRYVGFTNQHPDTNGFTALSAKHPSDWRGELGDQLDSLPDEIQYVLLVIEDFFFTRPVRCAELNAVADLMIREDLSYVRLIPVARGLLGHIPEWFRRKFSNRPLRVLSFSEPYYSSVETALWKRDYLRALLRQSGTIWEFERTVTHQRHYAVWNRVVHYKPLVGRGKWYFEAPRLLAQQGLSLTTSMRGRQSTKTTLGRLRQWLLFKTWGYLGYRIRRRLSMLPST